MDIFNDDIDVLEIIEYGFPRRVNQRRNHYEKMDNLTFFKRFRLYKHTFLRILGLIEERLEYPNERNNRLTDINQLLCTLRYYASAGHLRSVANFMGIDVATASRVIERVSQEIARLYPQFVKLPEPQAVVVEQEKYFQMYGFPRVIGVVDGTHIRLQSPGGEDGEVFRNRKGYYSLNMQVTTNADLKFIDIVARWPGSAHDATIFANSRLKVKMETGEYPNCILLGYSGYPLREYFLTPLDNPVNRGEELYNRNLIRARNSVERAIGLLKRRFPIMGYGMRLKLETSMAICVATGVFHNIAREMNESKPPPIDGLDIQQLNYLIETENINIPHPNEDLPVNVTRQEFINYFSLR